MVRTERFPDVEAPRYGLVDLSRLPWPAQYVAIAKIEDIGCRPPLTLRASAPALRAAFGDSGEAFARGFDLEVLFEQEYGIGKIV